MGWKSKLFEVSAPETSKLFNRLSSQKNQLGCSDGFLRFFNLYDKSRPENQTKLSEIDSFRTISKVLVYVLESFRLRFCSERETKNRYIKFFLKEFRV